MTPTAPDQYDTIVYRLIVLENTVKQLQEQFKLYVPLREHALQLDAIRDTTTRTEQEVIRLKTQVESVNDKIEIHGKEALKRDTEQSESLSKLQIRILWGAVSIVLAILGGVFVNYISHFIH